MGLLEESCLPPLTAGVYLSIILSLTGMLPTFWCGYAWISLFNSVETKYTPSFFEKDLVNVHIPYIVEDGWIEKWMDG